MTYINGQWTTDFSGPSKEVINPATGRAVETIGYGGAREAALAVEAADNAFGPWMKKTVYERAALLKQLADAIRANQDKLANILTQEVGKTVPESMGEVGAAADQFEWYAEEVKRGSGDVIPHRMDNRRHMTIRHPVGPVAAISPWNFPLLLSARKIAPALAAGCTVVCRPASQAPLALIQMFRLIDKIGFPKGVVNLVVGSPAQCSAVFIEDDRIKKISFTGSLEVGRQLYRACADQMKKISLELGGHSPFIVMPDADIEEAAELAAFSKYRNMGQVCISPSRFFVHHSQKEKFQTLVAQKVKKLKIGNGLDPFTEVGPLFDEGRITATQAFVADIREKGGTILCGGEEPKGEAFARGFFFEPTVATDITQDMLILNEEPFAPVMPILGYETRQEAIEMANNTPYGLAAYVMTQNLSWAVEAAEGLEAGMIGINDCAPAAAQCPFGGMKKSGVGREGWHQGLSAYYETKYVSLGI